MRASDAERERVARSLGAHLVAGRLKLDEFSARLEQAYQATTVDDLLALTADLGGEPVRPEPPRRRSRRPFWPGNLPFIAQFETSASAGTVRREAMRTVVPLLIAHGYSLETSQPTLLVLSKSYRPAWTILLSVVLFPFGLLALLHQEHCQVVIAVHRGDETEVEVAGTAPLAVRRAVHVLAE